MNDQLIKELDFILTHPSCSVENIETFYQTCLYLYEEVPLFIIVDHMRKTTPLLLKEWSDKNGLIRNVLKEMEIEDVATNEFNIHIDLSGVAPTNSGIYRVEWRTNLKERDITRLLKGKRIKVIDKQYGEVRLIGFSKESNHYNLYLKKWEENLS